MKVPRRPGLVLYIAIQRKDWGSPDTRETWAMSEASVDLFSGMGGFALAFASIACPVMYCDKCPNARATLSRLMSLGKLPTAPIIDDVLNTTGILHAVGATPVRLLTAGFPCTGISLAGKREGLNNPGSALFWAMMDIVRRLNPDHVFLENVPSITSMQGGEVLCTVLGALRETGYACSWTLKSASDVGSPQVRRRWFLLASRSGCDPLPTLRFRSSDFWTATERPSLAAIKCSEFVQRYALLGNAMVPQAVRAAFATLSGCGA